MSKHKRLRQGRRTHLVQEREHHFRDTANDPVARDGHRHTIADTLDVFDPAKHLKSAYLKPGVSDSIHVDTRMNRVRG